MIDTSKLKYFKPDTDPKIDWENVDEKAIMLLDLARELADTPFHITSNYRSPEHSEEVGGLNNDSHTQKPCSAFDIAWTNTLELYKIVNALFVAGFPRIGINPFNNHVHADCAPNLPTPRLWIETPDKLMIAELKKKGYDVTTFR